MAKRKWRQSFQTASRRTARARTAGPTARWSGAAPIALARGADGAGRPGRANGLRRYRCKACAKSFKALTGTPLARLRLKERWLEFTQSLSVGDTVQCQVALTTAFRWRHRFLKALKTTTTPLRGIVEADE